MPDWLYGVGFFALIMALMIGGAAVQSRLERGTFQHRYRGNTKEVRRL